MTLRQRWLLIASVVGVGILAFQPVMRIRLEARLSELLGSRVEIGSSKITLSDGVIALDNVVVHSGNGAADIQVAHAALKFDWKRFLYRDLKINSLVASEVQWVFESPNADRIPIADEANIANFWPEPTNGTSLGGVDSVLLPLKQKLRDESAKRSREQLEISSQMKMLEDRLAEELPHDNPLRNKSSSDEAKKELTKIRQLIAEARVDRKKSEAEFTSWKQTAQSKLTSQFVAASESATNQVRQNAIEIAKTTIAKQWNQSRPILYTSLLSMDALMESDQDNDAASLRSSSRNSVDNRSVDGLGLPKRLTKIDSGKIRGITSIGFPNLDRTHAKHGFEIRLNQLSNQIEPQDKPSVVVTVTEQTDISTRPMISCYAEKVLLPQSESMQIQFVYQLFREGKEACTTRVQHANQGWSSSIVVPIRTCIAEILTTSVQDFSNVNESQLNTLIEAKLVGTTSPASPSPSNILITIEPAGIGILEEVLLNVHRSASERLRAELELRGTERLNSELLTMGSRWNQLEDENTQAFIGWDRRFKFLETQVQQLESHRRASRPQSTNAK